MVIMKMKNLGPECSIMDSNRRFVEIAGFIMKGRRRLSLFGVPIQILKMSWKKRIESGASLT